MKYTKGLAIAIGLAISVGAVTTAFAQGGSIQTNRVAVVINPDDIANYGNVRSALNSTLEELGVHPDWVNAADIASMSPQALAKTYPALIFPDGGAQRLPAGFGVLVSEYVRIGGDVCVIADAGVRDPNGFFLPVAEMTPVTGVDYMRYAVLGVDAFGYYKVGFGDANLALDWHVQPGKIDKGFVVSGYYYGHLIFPMANAVVVPACGTQVVATDGTNPVITVRPSGSGNAVFCNAPLGYLKSIGDGMLTFGVIQRFLFDVAKLPRLLPVKDGIGRMVLNWHVDSGKELTGIPAMEKAGLLRKGIMQEFHVTAGPDLDTPGDGLGLDVLGKGRAIVEKIMKYGVVGNHGGWAHDWFASNISNGTFTEDDIEHYVSINGDALMSITGQPISGYAAPVGVHPPFKMARVLARLGIDSYYYTGDTGSPVTRAYSQGQMLSETVWAYPLSTYQKWASLYEYRENGIPDKEILEWLKGLVDFVATDRTTRIIYSHPYDLSESSYEKMFGKFLDYVEKQQDKGNVMFDTMKNITAHMNKVIATQFQTTMSEDGKTLTINLSNRNSLKGIAFIIPKDSLPKKFEDPEDKYVDYSKQKGGDYLFWVKKDVKDLTIAIKSKK